MKEKLKICHITTAHTRYDSRIFLKECTTLAANKRYDVNLICLDDFGIENKNNVCIIGIDIGKKSKLKRILLGSYYIKKFLKNHSYDVYHFHDLELLNLAYKLSKSGKCVIFDSHEDYFALVEDKKRIPKVFKKFFSNILMYFQKRTFKKCNAVITVTPHIKDKIVKYNSNTHIVENFPIVEKFTKRYKHKKNINLCFAGGISKQWMHHSIINALANLKNIKYDVAGISFNSKYFEELKKNDINKNMKFLGRLSHKDVKKLYGVSDVGMALNDYSFNVDYHNGSIGNTKIFEYMEAGLPLIATDFKLWKEIIEENNCGICINPNNVEDIKNAITFFIKNPEKIKEYGINGRRMIEKFYNWDESAKKLLDIYKELEIV